MSQISRRIVETIGTLTLSVAALSCNKTEQDIYDWNNDGIVDCIEEYNSEGRLVRRDTDDFSFGYMSRTETFRYDSQGNLVEKVIDEILDGGCDQVQEYDINGNLMKEQFDFSGDGITDRIDTYKYDSRNNRIESSYDFDGDGVVDRIITYTYDFDNNLIGEFFDKNGDGVIDRTTKYEEITK